MEKLTTFGVGPKILLFTFPFLAATIILSYLFPSVFAVEKEMHTPLMIAGMVLLIPGLVFYLSTVRIMLPGIRSNKLVTKGTFRFCRNPLYSAVLLFMLPGLSFLLGSWIILIASIAGYAAFRIYIHEEEEMLERIFGEEYLDYKKRTSLFFPNPFRKS